MTNDNNWNVIYTKSRAEKKVNELLKEQGITTYLPLVKEIRQWSDRKKKVEVPLISSYLFVKTNKKNHINILKTQGVVNFLKFKDRLAVVTDEEIENLKLITENNIPVQLTDNTQFTIGEKVKLNYKNKWVSGKIVKKLNKRTLIIEIKEMGIYFQIDIFKNDVIKI